MNRKIYFKDKYIEFSDTILQFAQNQSIKVYNTIENDLVFKNIINEFIEDSNLKSLGLLNQDFDSILKRLKKHFYYIEAAGGFIEKEKEFLCIHRLGRWDLPKGKLEKDETIEAAAIRECEEESGVRKLKIVRPLSSTFHIYSYKQGFALKQSYWFYMHTDYDKKLIAQTEEHIDKVKWFTKKEIESQVLDDTYYTIRDVIREALDIKEGPR